LGGLKAISHIVTPFPARRILAIICGTALDWMQRPQAARASAFWCCFSVVADLFSCCFLPQDGREHASHGAAYQAGFNGWNDASLREMIAARGLPAGVAAQRVPACLRLLPALRARRRWSRRSRKHTAGALLAFMFFLWKSGYLVRTN